MKHNYLKRMIKEAGGEQSRHPEKWDIWEFNNDAVERFAKLVYESAFHDANIAASATILHDASFKALLAMQKIIEALQLDDDCLDPRCAECKPWRLMREAINELSEALAEKRDE